MGPARPTRRSTAGPELATDVLLVTLGTTAGLRLVEDELAGSLRRAGATVEVARTERAPELRTFPLLDLAQARAARRAARAGIAAHRPRAVLYSTTTAALLWPAPGAIHFDAPAAGNRPGRHGVWQRPLERRRFAAAPLLVAQSAGALEEAPGSRDEALVIPVPVEPSGAPGEPRDLAALTYAADVHKKGLDRVLEAWSRARREDEELVVAGTESPAGPNEGSGPGAPPGGADPGTGTTTTPSTGEGGPPPPSSSPSDSDAGRTAPSGRSAPSEGGAPPGP